MDVIQSIKELEKTKSSILIGIDGPCASGKSTLAKELAKALNANTFMMDDYFLPPYMKTSKRLSTIGGNVHFERIKKEVFDHLESDSITFQKFNCKTNKYEVRTTLPSSKITIIEGAYAFHKELRDYYDFKILLSVDNKIQLERIRKRNGEDMLQRFINEWIPLENKYFDSEHLEDIADLILERNE